MLQCCGQSHFIKREKWFCNYLQPHGVFQSGLSLQVELFHLSMLTHIRIKLPPMRSLKQSICMQTLCIFNAVWNPVFKLFLLQQDFRGRWETGIQLRGHDNFSWRRILHKSFSVCVRVFYMFVVVWELLIPLCVNIHLRVYCRVSC